MSKTLRAIVVVMAAIIPLGALATQAAATGTVCAEAPDVRFYVGGPQSVTVNLGAELPAGPYILELTATDSYPDRPGVDNGQDTERITALGVTTPDLADGVETASTSASGTVELTGPTSAITITHAPASPGPNSVAPGRLCLTPITPEPQPEPEPEPELVEVDPVDEPAMPTPEPEPAPAPVEEPAPTIPMPAPAEEPAPEVAEPVVVERETVTVDIEIPEAVPATPIVAQPRFTG